MLQFFGIFSEYAGLKLNTAKCKIAGIGEKGGTRGTLRYDIHRHVK